jgi:hypothetical protein
MKSKNIISNLLISLLLLVNSSLVYSASDFDKLRLLLQQYKFSVILKKPPQTGNYGLLDTKTRIIWINPVVFELKIAEATLVHEAVHAAQLCASPSQIKPLYLGLEYPKIAYPHFMRYQGDRRHIEAEAYTVQTRTDRVNYVINLLNKHC